MLKAILLGLDDTPASLQAAALALALAKVNGAALTGLTVVDAERLAKPEAVPLGGDSYKAHKDEVLVGMARQHLNEVARRFAKDCASANLRCNAEVIEGDAIDNLIGAADMHDLIVIGRDAAFHTDTKLVSEIVERLLHRNPRPVVVVPEAELTAANVIVAYDGSVAAMRALQMFCLLQVAGRGETIVVSAGPDLAAAQGTSARAVEYMRIHRIDARAHAVATKSEPADAILEVAAGVGPQLIVMGAFGARGWRDFLLGSTTDKLIAQSRWPLFIHH